MKPNPLRPPRIARAVREGAPATAFSLLEMMTVLALLLIFASFVLPTYQSIMLRTREAALRDDLYTMRSMIDRFTLDNKRAPASLEELVEAGYLGAIPSDPFTRSTDTWQARSASPASWTCGVFGHGIAATLKSECCPTCSLD